MADRVRPYLYYDTVISICTECYRKIDGKILFQDGNVFLVKRCPTHGTEKVLVADDVDYYRRSREVFIKPPEMPNHFNTPIKWGCPYDCGLCPDHEQHSCLSLIEITDHCNLDCPICYASSGTHRQSYRSLAQVERMLDAVVRNEREPDVVQISGGEPTIHPDFFAILDAARARPIRHLMVNTNGIRVATEEGFAERLAEYGAGFELYLQFDSFERDALMSLRGADLRRIRERALEKLNALNISTTLVVTLKKGVNDHEVGTILEYAVAQRAVRGVTFQPIQHAGRAEGFDPASQPADAHRGEAEDSRADVHVPRRRCHTGAVPSGFAGHGVRTQARRQGGAPVRPGRPADPHRRWTKHDPLRGGSGGTGRNLQALCDQSLAGIIGAQPPRPALLPAQGGGARVVHVPEHLSRAHRAVHRRARL
jgi:molybdenum cofactor biosynthesis enzyme MoaA